MFKEINLKRIIIWDTWNDCVDPTYREFFILPSIRISKNFENSYRKNITIYINFLIFGIGFLVYSKLKGDTHD